MNGRDRHAEFRRVQELVERTTSTKQDSNSGETLALFQRGETERLRLARKLWNERPYLDLRVEFLNESGSWSPTKKGLSIRRGEIAGLVEALEREASDAG